MGVLSKLGPTATALRPIIAQLGPLKNQVRFGGGARVFYAMDPALKWKRAANTVHFYIVGIGILPVLAMCGIVNVVYGKCELQDWPENGFAPRHWQYEEGIMTQWFTKYFYGSAQWGFERRLAAVRENVIKQKFRLRVRRAERLVSERQDYKAWFYVPFKEEWVDHSKYRREWKAEDYEMISHHAE